MTHNCIDCKHKESAFSDLSKIPSGMQEVKKGYFVQCLVGNNDIILDFYKRNIEKSSSEITETVSCFEETKFSRDTNKLISMMNDLLNEIKKNDE